jgi:hypothetical protein
LPIPPGIPNLHLIRASRETEPIHAIHEPERPYLCLRLDYDRHQIVDLIQRDTSPNKPSDAQRALFVSKMNGSLLDAVVRLVRLLDTPEDIPVIAPLITQEILYRILQGEQGQSLKRLRDSLGLVGS